MQRPSEQQIRAIMSGAAKGPKALLLRGLLNVAEPFYAGAMSLRNAMFDAGIRKTHRLPRPVISIGNLTTGGTGKTPMVRWLAQQLRNDGLHTAILSRGYRSKGQGLGDELTMLDRALNQGDATPILLRANPNRFAAGTALIAEHPELDVIVLDDAFQHRRVARNLDIVLINAAEPFGFSHVLPRGMLRERMAGLNRAGAVVLTHADRSDDDALRAIESMIRRFNASAPLYRAKHALSAIRSKDRIFPLSELSGRRFFAFSGIGNPDAFEKSVAAIGNGLKGCRRFQDHHAYVPADLEELGQSAQSTGAELLLTTEKDWVKIEAMHSDAHSLPIWRVEMQLEFFSSDEDALLTQVRSVLPRHLKKEDSPRRRGDRGEEKEDATDSHR